jgi:hypothetical protein
VTKEQKGGEEIKGTSQHEITPRQKLLSPGNAKKVGHRFPGGGVSQHEISPSLRTTKSRECKKN